MLVDEKPDKEPYEESDEEPMPKSKRRRKASPKAHGRSNVSTGMFDALRAVINRSMNEIEATNRATADRLYRAYADRLSRAHAGPA